LVGWANVAGLTEPPVRLCCGERHWSPQCPDGTVWCCVCFDHFTEDELYVDEDGQKWDICKPCKARDHV
jgi:hypothetical protein